MAMTEVPGRVPDAARMRAMFAAELERLVTRDALLVFGSFVSGVPMSVWAFELFGRDGLRIVETHADRSGGPDGWRVRAPEVWDVARSSCSFYRGARGRVALRSPGIVGGDGRGRAVYLEPAEADRVSRLVFG